MKRAKLTGVARLLDMPHQLRVRMVPVWKPGRARALVLLHPISLLRLSKRYDQTLGGDGNLIADLCNLKLDFGYVRYAKQGIGLFDQRRYLPQYPDPAL